MSTQSIFAPHSGGGEGFSFVQLPKLLVFVALVLMLLATACSPEGERVRGGGPGGDIGNRGQPVQLHGDRTRNNPDFRVPGKVSAPRGSWGIPGWWAGRAQ